MLKSMSYIKSSLQLLKIAGVILFLLFGIVNTLSAGVLANDNFSDAIAITGLNGQITGNSFNATKETGEFDHAGDVGGASVWWKWTAPTDGSITIDTFGSSFDTLLGVYTGSAVNALTEIVANDDAGADVQSLVTFDAVSGITYYIAVDGFDGETGSVTLNWHNLGNDNFTDAIVITGLNGQTTGTNGGATKETGEPNHAGNVGGASVWWKWIAPSSGSITIDTFGSSFDTLLGVYTGSAVDGLTPIASNNDKGADFQSKVTFNAVNGTTYYIAVDGFDGDAGSVTLNWHNPPSNDNFTDAIAITGVNGQTTGINDGATKETGEPDLAGNIDGASVWWKWTALSDGSITIDTFGSSFDTLLGVYTGSAVNALTEIDSNDDASGNSQSQVTFNAVNGTTYYIAVDGFDGDAGSVTLNWHLASFSIITSTDALDVPEGTTNTFQVKLSAAPAASVTIAVANSAGDGDITVSSGASLPFTTTNWDTYQTVTLTAAEDNTDKIAGTTTITCTSNNAANKDVTATEIDDDFTLTVTDDGNGTTTPSTGLVDKNNSPFSITATTNVGYEFDQWTVTNGAGTFVDANLTTTTVSASGNLTIHASFSQLYTVSYNANGATSGTAPGDQTKTHGTDLTLASNTGTLVKTNYTYSGWNTATGGDGTDYAEDATYSTDAALTLYAKWIPITQYTLIVENGTGDGNYASGKVVSITADTPALYKQFDKWTGDIANVADVNSSDTTITMLAANAIVTATYVFDTSTAETVTMGMVKNIDAAEVNDSVGTALTNFTKRPKVYAYYYDPIKDLSNLKEKRAPFKVLTKVVLSPNLEACWTRIICLYDKKVFKTHYKNGEKFKDFTGQKTSLEVSVYVAHKEGGIVTDSKLSRVFSLLPPEITSLETTNGTALANPVAAAGEILIKGNYFGNKAPKVWLEYLNSKGQIKAARCKVIKPYKYTDVKGNAGKSCMDKTTGVSEITVQMPGKWPKDWVHGTNDLVIDNKIGMATTTLETQ